MIALAVAAADLEWEAEARALAQKLNLPQLPTAISPRSIEDPQAILFSSAQGLYLQQTGKGAPGPVAARFGTSAMRHRRRAGQNEPLGRAVGVGKKPQIQVLDATAGLGRDSFILADLGCQVRLCERHPIMVELLASGLVNARGSGDAWLEDVCGRLELCVGEARQLDSARLQEIDAIYLDPMFPARSKSASVKKEMSLVQQILDCADSPSDAEDLLQWSLGQNVSRVVVKRPAKAPALASGKPSHVIGGKSIRFDVYVKGSLV